MSPLRWLLLVSTLASLLAGCPWIEGDAVGECDDGVDNDNDGDVDCDDRGCMERMICSYPPGDDDDDDDVCCDDDTWSDDDDQGAEIKAVWPAEDATDAYHRAPIIVWFTDDVTTAAITLVDGQGLVIPGDSELGDRDTRLTFDPHGDDPDQHLLPRTDYVATIHWDESTAELAFSTSSAGEPLVDAEDTVEGRDWLRDVSEGFILEPHGLGSLIAQYLSRPSVLHVTDLDAASGRAEGYGGQVAAVDGAWVQDLCQATVSLSGQDTGSWDNPYLSFAPTQPLTASSLSVDGETWGEYTLHGWRVDGSFLPGTSRLVGGTLTATVDTRGLDAAIDPDAGEGVTCDLLSSLGIGCLDCPDGSGPFCLPIEILDMESEPVEVTGTHPETGEPFAGLVEVTEEMVVGWQAGGFCP